MINPTIPPAVTPMAVFNKPDKEYKKWECHKKVNQKRARERSEKPNSYLLQCDLQCHRVISMKTKALMVLVQKNYYLLFRSLWITISQNKPMSQSPWAYRCFLFISLRIEERSRHGRKVGANPQSASWAHPIKKDKDSRFLLTFHVAFLLTVGWQTTQTNSTHPTQQHR